MRFSNTYRILLFLYPADFRRHFSAEMLFVFEQRENEHLTDRGSTPFAFLLTEFWGIMKGAYIMWFAKIIGVNRKSLVAGSNDFEFRTPHRSGGDKTARRGNQENGCLDCNARL